MRIDFEQFKDVDFENVGGWPKAVKVFFGLLVATSVFIASYFLVIADAKNELGTMQGQEGALKASFKNKYQLAANLAHYREQLALMEVQFAKLLKMLPSENEMPGLIDDVTFVATDTGLKIHSLEWGAELQQDFYIEFPIKILVSGDYHELGYFVSGVAKLPRIVSLHDFTLKKGGHGGLEMQMLAKTYRFKEGADLKDGKKAKKKKVKK
ncbi:type 4a pilus biogenesis protein PilO [Shewanella surugensis]|uniref:Type 4a pilus biogenesis protein PilO n=1 Tax=Shewanella surugensis TaxID=212020 RepID=A0ABT0LCY2_9GAMM|nr:type 4a pilus biogenesis protein PilO [Shewanella surugensis]MCL1125561.1 type 4a pilus biogenesis protein PilO [Shewanella surugensis]